MLLANQIRYLLNKVITRKLLAWFALIFFAYALGTSLAYFSAPSALPKVYNFATYTNDTSSKPNNQLASLDDFSIIEKRNLFDLSKHQTTEEVAAIQEATQTATQATTQNTENLGLVGILPLDARLVGTVDVDKDELSRAIVIYEGVQRIIKNGEVFAGYTVKSIKRNEVVFELNGIELKLEQKFLK